MGITYRAFDPKDVVGQRELFSLCFPEAKGTPAEGVQHHKWKFGGFPSVPSSYQYVGQEEGTLVGYYAALPYQYVIDGVRHRAGMVCDVMTHPGYRGKGIFTQIGRFATGELANEGIGFTTGYPIRPEVIPGHLKVGWRVVQTMPTYVRPVGISGVLPSWLKPVGAIADGVIRGLQAWSHGRGAGYSTKVHTRDAFMDGIAGRDAYAAFLEEWAGEQKNALWKDARFLSWRTGAPETEYRFVTLSQGEKLVGLAIVRPTKLRGIGALAVLDFMVLSDHLGGCRALHWALVGVARSERKDVVACMSSKAWAATYRFAGSCYIRTPSVFSLIVKKLDPNIPDELLQDPNRWHLFWIDSDDL